ncbi:MAG: hypothetical protein MI757_14950 [Pirellulales bacterium]|nr:hypothetical protein [Pirellulales bacterium]
MADAQARFYHRFASAAKRGRLAEVAFLRDNVCAMFTGVADVHRLHV